MGHWPLPYQPIYKGFIRVGVCMRKAAQPLAAGCKIENVIASAAGPEMFTLGESIRLRALAVGAHVGLVHTPASLGFARTRLVGQRYVSKFRHNSRR